MATSVIRYSVAVVAPDICAQITGHLVNMDARRVIEEQSGNDRFPYY
jgi:hypothetical protein